MTVKKGTQMYKTQNTLQKAAKKDKNYTWGRWLFKKKKAVKCRKLKKKTWQKKLQMAAIKNKKTTTTISQQSSQGGTTTAVCLPCSRPRSPRGAAAPCWTPQWGNPGWHFFFFSLRARDLAVVTCWLQSCYCWSC